MAEKIARRQAIPAAWKLEALRNSITTVVCKVCCEPKPLACIEFDHHLALIDDGTHAVDNIRPVCAACHAKKSANEHKANAKCKRLAAAQEVHEKVVARVMKREPSRLKGRGFDKTRSKLMDGTVVKR